MSYLIKKRAVALFWVFTIVFTGLTGRLAYIQVYQNERLSRLAISQQSQVVPLEIPARGQILDRNLKPLISYREVWRVAVFPAAISHKQSAAALLTDVLGLDQEQAMSYLSGKAGLIPLALTSKQAAELGGKSIPGIIVTRVRERLRKPSLASHILGYIGKDGPNEWNGKMGIEAYYDADLQGSRPVSAVRAFFDGRGHFVSGLGFPVEKDQIDPSRKNVVLTIDRDIQEIVERALDSAGVKDGAAAVMDAGNGDLLAVASRPDYNIGNLAADTVYSVVYKHVYSSGESFLNHALSFYQPGSVFKIIVAAAALEEGLVKPDDVFLCVGEKDELVGCYEAGGHGLITFAQAFAFSCNPTFARIGLKLGAEKLIEYGKKFGFGDGGIIGYRENDTGTRLERIAQRFSLVNASLGQWPVEATVVQVTAMTAAIANDGVYISPRLVRELRNSDGTVARTFVRSGGTRAVSRETAGVMGNFLETVTRYGTGRQAWVEPWGSAGKTGSAQVGSAKTDAWFTGYAPAKMPRYAVTVLVNNGESGGKNAAPVFREIMSGILKRDKQK